ncbi:ATP synthase F1 subunit epsilon [Candidatus Roizmanbacteria bacterium RIFCSPLOWO2_01_FULL_38_11]|uniref:ATP synthase epsilon chain n=1 Tax=Candidatus Roizmanbacteria bacterium RIFCSPLOWO2_01_FULL_38_11 TaxID=1802060 RepID=A0A1F7ILD3_9BACT|nr:MAG: ATP synthase F1 subunit epsilon [Candidatus Roizmanbacteria bacterium RIFCSPLOWO2_01_FULL_38_11]
MKLKILTPKKVVLEEEITSITAPGADGEVTILPHHVSLFILLKEGVVKILSEKEESFFSIGGGYLETDGKEVNLLVSRAYGQDEIDEAEVVKAQQEAERYLKEAKTDTDRQQAMEMLHRSLIDSKLLSKVKHRRRTQIS